MEFSIIVAADASNGIGFEGRLPWSNSTDGKNSVHNLDMRFFKALTSGQIDGVSEFFAGLDKTEHKYYMSVKTEGPGKDVKSAGVGENIIIMGRRTADSFKTALPSRMNVVITSADKYREAEGFVCYKSLTNALQSLSKTPNINKVYVIGGSMLYDEAIKSNWCRTIFFTRFNESYSHDVCLSDYFVKQIESDGWNDDVDRCNVDGATFEQHTYCNLEEQAYLDLGIKIKQKGNFRQTRNATTYSLFGEKLEFDITEDPEKPGLYTVPILTTKTIFMRAVIEELLFFLRGETDAKILSEKGVKIWDANTNQKFLDSYKLSHLKEGEMGPMYGYQWRHFGAPYKGAQYDYKQNPADNGVDQLEDAINLLVSDPNSRRNIFTTFNPAQVSQGVLHPCHGIVTQLYVTNNKVCLQTYQRSADYFLGLPFNIASYAVLLCIVVEMANSRLKKMGKATYTTGRIIIVLGDVHIYSDTDSGIDHIQAVDKQLKFYDKPFRFPQIVIDKNIESMNHLSDMSSSDIHVVNYAHHPAIKAEMVA